MKRLTTVAIALAGVLSLLGSAQAANILWDVNAPRAGALDAVLTDFAAAGVTEDLTGSSVSLVTASANATMTDANGVTLAYVDNTAVNHYLNGTDISGYGGTAITKEYIYVRNSDPLTMRIGGLAAQLEPNQAYSFYIWGMGDSAGQNSTFTFNGITLGVPDGDPAASPASAFVVKFSFITGATVSDTLDFTWARTGTQQYAGLNGFAIVEDVLPLVLPPTDVTASAARFQIDLAWSASPSAESYTIYRSANNVDYTELTNGVTTTSYTDSTVPLVDVPYYYYLTSVSNGLESLRSVTASAEAFAVDTPVNLTATGGDRKIDLAWSASTYATSYSIYWSPNDADFFPLTSGVTTTSYTDTSVHTNLTYYYYVTAISNAYASSPSLTASALAYDGSDVTPPLAPADLTAVQGNSVGVQLDWTPNTDTNAADWAGHLVYRALTADGVYSNIGTTTDSSYIDTHATQRAGVFDYKVTAVDYSGNESAATAAATVDMASRYIVELDDKGLWGWLDAADGRTENTGDIGGGRNLGWTGAGEWTTHLVDVPEPGYYGFMARCAVNNGGEDAEMDVYVLPDTNTVMGTIVMPSTGGWQSWTTAPPSSVFLPVSGVNTVQLYQATGGFNLNWIEIVKGVTKLTSIDVAGTDVILSWVGANYRLYDVEETADLAADPVAWDLIPDLTNMPGVAGTMMATTTISGAFAAYRLLESPVPEVTVYTTDFESGLNNWTTGVVGAAGTAWELGTPTTGPGAANSPANCWGTNLDTNHGLDADVWLRSPVIELTEANEATLRFAQFIDIEDDSAASDAAIVNVLDSTGVTVLAEISNEDGTTDPVGWESIELSLPSEAVGQPVIIEFRFISDNFANQAGWYIDDMSVTVP